MLIKNKSFYFILNFFPLFIFLFLFAPVAFAEEADPSYELAITKAADKIENSDYEGAIDDLDEILRLKPEDEQATLYLGIALSRSGDRDAEEILKKALLINPKNPVTNLELGIYYFGKSMDDEAGDYFENTIKLAPNTEYSTKAREYIGAIKQGGAVKRWILNMSAGGQYDSNVIVNSDNGPLPEGISRKSDWKAILFLNGRYDLIADQRTECSVGYRFYQSFHIHLSNFNITSNLLDLKASYRISPELSINGLYSFEHVLVGGNPYDYSHILSPSLIISEGKGFSTIVEYKYRNTHFMDMELFEDNSDRTGANNLFGITQNIPISTSIIFNVGYSYDVDSTREDFWDYSGNKGMVGLQFNLPSYLYINLYGEYYHKNYEGTNPLSDEERKDRVSTATASATKQISDRFSITLGQLYTRNKSNIEEYDYKRSITSFFLNVRF
ncbi:MAG: hypothetical protein A2Y97_04605 [Nitrospirae bacterium RBG_13_39_12]|nr:MAG: hypothetical protein A2Y97_04605 [Nitrospirae bacterium RBG_13_39_12]